MRKPAESIFTMMQSHKREQETKQKTSENDLQIHLEICKKKSICINIEDSQTIVHQLWTMTKKLRERENPLLIERYCETKNKASFSSVMVMYV